jgi:hypothetical protein
MLSVLKFSAQVFEDVKHLAMMAANPGRCCPWKVAEIKILLA